MVFRARLPQCRDEEGDGRMDEDSARAGSRSALERLAGRLADRVPAASRGLRDDLRRTFRAVLETALTDLDLVTREEFDIQAAVLRRTRERLETLEREVARLERERGTGIGE